MTVSAVALATLEQLLNLVIRLDPEAPARLAPMHGRIIELRLRGLGLSLYLIPEPNGIQLLGGFEGEPDCSLCGSPLDLARMRDSRDSAEQLFSRAVEIEGDSALAHRFGAFLTALEIDWEEQLSRITGDFVAHELGNLGRALVSSGRTQQQTQRQNLREYLQEELRLLPGPLELEPFFRNVDRLRDDLARLEARVARLQGSMKQKGEPA